MDIINDKRKKYCSVFSMHLIAASLFITSFLNAQTIASDVVGNIVYTIQVDSSTLFESLEKTKIENPAQYEMLGEEMKACFFITRQFATRLRFDADEAVSFLIEDEVLANEDKYLYEIAKIMAKCGDVHYLALSTNQRITEVSLDMGATFYHVVEPWNPYNWEITQETKKVGEYECIKAKGHTSIELINTELATVDIEAWFAPALPFPFGPMGYDGLPGIVLEATVYRNIPITYIAQKVEIKKGEKNTKLSSLRPALEEISRKEFEILINRKIPTPPKD
ncbi:MAG: GLPGLI family protein [Saprospiraceae bacterium]